jgi:hypothetical protein
MALADVRIRTAKPLDKPYKLFDGGGLFVLVKPSGSKLWRFFCSLVVYFLSISEKTSIRLVLNKT